MVYLVVFAVCLRVVGWSWWFTQRAQYGFIREHTLNHTWDPYILLDVHSFIQLYWALRVGARVHPQMVGPVTHGFPNYFRLSKANRSGTLVGWRGVVGEPMIF